MNAIYASGLNGEFALEDGTLPWKKNSLLQKECKEDMDFFKHMTAKKAVIMGSEGSGLSKLLQEQCDYTVSIPTSGKIDSLNVSVASGILLYEIYRRTL